MAKYKCTKENGYGAKKTVVTHNGKKLLIDSKLEAREAIRLIAMERSGKIKYLVFQPQFQLVPSFYIYADDVKNGKRKQQSIKYTPDFSYIEVDTGDHVIVEAKGFATDVYKLRKRLFLSMLNELDVDVFMEVFSRKKVIFKPIRKIDGV